MPYIPKTRRTELCGSSHYLTDIDTAGELNFCITKLLIQYCKQHGVSYITCNDVVGALENAKHEFQRRIQDPYEDIKIKQHSDVYTDILCILEQPK